jgi:hypothetical protein
VVELVETTFQIDKKFTIFTIMKLRISIVLLMMICFAKAQTKDNVLANKTFSIEVTENNSTGSIDPMPKDRIQFRAGKINTGFSQRNSFPDAVYIVTVDSTSIPHVISFSGECVKSDKQTLKWSGTVVGDKIEGKAHRDRNGKSSCDYVFSGSLKK